MRCKSDGSSPARHLRPCAGSLDLCPARARRLAVAHRARPMRSGRRGSAPTTRSRWRRWRRHGLRAAVEGRSSAPAARRLRRSRAGRDRQRRHAVRADVGGGRQVNRVYGIDNDIAYVVWQRRSTSLRGVVARVRRRRDGGRDPHRAALDASAPREPVGAASRAAGRRLPQPARSSPAKACRSDRCDDRRRQRRAPARRGRAPAATLQPRSAIGACRGAAQASARRHRQRPRPPCGPNVIPGPPARRRQST